VLSKNKEGLGKAMNFEHKIDLNQDNPIYVKQFPMPETHRDIQEGQIKKMAEDGNHPTNPIKI
jgi:hypothetical protein